MQAEQVPQIVAEVELVRLITRQLASLLPNEEDRRARTILPPDDSVRAQLLEVESTRIAFCQAASSVFPSRTGATVARVATAEVAVAREAISRPSMVDLPGALEANSRAGAFSGCAGICASETAGIAIMLKRTRIFINDVIWRGPRVDGRGRNHGIEN